VEEKSYTITNNSAYKTTLWNVHERHTLLYIVIRRYSRFTVDSFEYKVNLRQPRPVFNDSSINAAVQSAKSTGLVHTGTL